MNKGWNAIALHGGAAAFALALGYGAVTGVVSAGNSLTVAGPAPRELSSETPTPGPAPGDRADGGGALPVVPVGGSGCISGLNCGCIRYVTCPGTVRHHHPAPANDHPPDAPGPGPGGG